MSVKEAKVSIFPDLGSDLTGQVIKSAIEVHRELGPGLLESVYESCLFQELADQGLEVERQKALPVFYKGRQIDQGFRIDLLVSGRVLIEVKACDAVTPVHKAQIVTYMRLSKTPVGLLINFNRKVLKDGIQRFALAEFDEHQSQTEINRDFGD